ncbi:MAG: hypothetical protein IJU18_06050 [Oscillospiraceae bacterium]|nr:hypothetical protein [Oscillospiraceae bacterium]
MLDVRLKDIRRLEKEVLNYEAQEIVTGKILFYGDSGFTRWSARFGNRPMEEDLAAADGSVAVVNHGFGTSTAEEQLYYYDRLVRPWKPRVLVNKCHGNDWDQGYSPAEILFLQSRLFEYARRDMPGIRIFVCDGFPCIKNRESVSNLHAQEQEYNALLADYCRRHDDVTLLSHWSSPLFFVDPERVGEYDNLREDVFIEDKVHYNQKGYDLYAKFFRDALQDLLK